MKKKSPSLPYVSMLLILLVSAPSLAAMKPQNYLLSGASLVGGDTIGGGGYLGLAKAPEGELGLFHGIFAGGFGQSKTVMHADYLTGLNYMRMLSFFAGLGVRQRGTLEPVGQVTYGIAVGPTSMALRRYPASKGVVTEGLIALNLPLLSF